MQTKANVIVSDKILFIPVVVDVAIVIAESFLIKKKILKAGLGDRGERGGGDITGILFSLAQRSSFIIHQIFSLARDWSQRVT